MSERVVIAVITRVAEGASAPDQDLVAAEAPLEIVLSHEGGPPHSLGLVMRTAGDDADLVRGLLVGEQVVTNREEILGLAFSNETPAATDAEPASPARACVTLAPSVDLASLPAARVLDRTSACGLCGRLAMQAVRASGVARTPDAPAIRAGAIRAIPARLRQRQAVFAETGGLHAAALCDLAGEPWLVREDVGRHNAVDKVVGGALEAGALPAASALLAVSGRVAYEIVQKAAAAGVLGIVAVGAPSSLAVDAARAAGLTLVGFTRADRFNVYAGGARIVLDADNSPTR